MRVTLLWALRMVIAGAIGAGPAYAMAEGSWAFCYVDPPTFGSGAFVYTRVIYVGGAVLPKDSVASVLVEANPQVGQRPISCWRYGSQAEAESRRQQGMSFDRGRGYSIEEVTFQSPFTYDPKAIEPAAPIASVATPPSRPPPAAASTDKAAAEAATAPAASKPAAAANAEPKAPSQPVESANARYERELAEYRRQMALNAQQKADYNQSLQAHQQRVVDLAAQTEKARQEFEQRRAKWEADVAACKAGDYSKCATSPQ